MSALPAHSTAPPTPAPRISTRSFSMYGVGITVATDLAEAAALLDDTFGEFAAPAVSGCTVVDVVHADDDAGFFVTGANGAPRAVADAREALVAMLDTIAETVSSGLYRRGLLAVHAGALAHRGRALLVAGPSGYGKTTLTLGLVRAGLGFLSDELGVLDPATGQVCPFPRSALVRPATRALIPELAALCGRARRDLGDGNKWIVTPGALASRFACSRSGAAPLGAVVLLAAPPDPARPPALTPTPPGIAVLELLRGTPAAAIDFGAALSLTARSVRHARCARLEGGALADTVAAVLAWLDGGGGA